MQMDSAKLRQNEVAVVEASANIMLQVAKTSAKVKAPLKIEANSRQRELTLFANTNNGGHKYDEPQIQNINSPPAAATAVERRKMFADRSEIVCMNRSVSAVVLVALT